MRWVLGILPLFCSWAACVGDAPATTPDASNDSATSDAAPDHAATDSGLPDVVEAGPFDGNYYGNLELWLSADFGVSDSDAGVVSSWQDRSSKQRSVSVPPSDPTCQGGPTVVPSAIHGLPTLKFDGATQCLGVSGPFTDFSLGFTAFVLLQPANCNSSFTGNNGAVFDSSDNTSFNHSDPISIARNYAESAQVASGDGILFSGTGSVGITGGSSWVPATAELLEFRLPAASGGSLVSGTAFVNGTFQTNLNPNDPLIPQFNSARTTTYVGLHASGASGYHFYCGMIGEMLVYSKALSDPDRQAVESYLKTRWGI